MFFVIVSIIVLLLLIAALISGLETAITACSPGRIHKYKTDGKKNAKLILGFLQIRDKIISTLLVGNSLANTICTTIATGLFIEYMGEELGTIAASVIMSILIIVFSEVIPKNIAVSMPERLAIFFAPLLLVLLKVLQPVIYLLEFIVKIVCNIFGIDRRKSEISGADELRGEIDHKLSEGVFFKSDRDMLGGILDIGSLNVVDIMIHRSDVIALDMDQAPAKIIDHAIMSGKSRIPVWQENTDNIIGILHVRDITEAMHKKQGSLTKADISKLVTEPWFVPENVPLNKQLQAFLTKQTHLACVVDEYGTFEGIITFEDIIEEIFGQIYDEKDKQQESIKQLSDNEYIISGSVPVRDLNRELGWSLPEEKDATTIAGLMINQLERIPNKGESVEISEYGIKLVVLKKVVHRIIKVKAITTKTDEKE